MKDLGDEGIDLSSEKLSTEKIDDFVKKTVKKHGADRTELLAMLWDLQREYRHIPEAAINSLAEELDELPVHIEGTSTFYHFFSKTHRGQYSIYLNTSITAEMAGLGNVQKTFEKELDIGLGSTTVNKQFGLFSTSCIGMSDLEPAALINEVVFCRLDSSKVKILISELKGKKVLDFSELSQLSEKLGSAPSTKIHWSGPVFFQADPAFEVGTYLKLAMEADGLEVIERITKSGLRGRGGAGFPTGQKWGFCRAAPTAVARYIFCNADEGEPGTFKDRVLLTEKPELVFEGMIIAAFAIESKQGFVYLRSEYTYLREHLEACLADMREKNLLGRRILGTRFSFDIHIKMGAGAYICGEESALIESAEGKRGQPRNRPPFPVTSGYLNQPTIVNNPETFACAARIVGKGPEWFRKMGTPASAGVKLLSVSGDCKHPGVYEVVWGITVREVLQLCGASDTLAVQVGGPSGTLISSAEWDRRICYSDLGTGGAFTIFDQSRDLFQIIRNYMKFFVAESCGFCVPCRAGNSLLLRQMEKIMIGDGTMKDLEDIKKLGAMIKMGSRCGLGQTSSQPLLTGMKYFAEKFGSAVRQDTDYLSQFDLKFATEAAKLAAGRALDGAD